MHQYCNKSGKVPCAYLYSYDLSFEFNKLNETPAAAVEGLWPASKHRDIYSGIILSNENVFILLM